MERLDASFKISTDSISLGFKKLRSLTIEPSTIYIGSVLLIEPIPLILTLGEAPGAPELIICTPATFPCKELIAF